MSKIEWTSVKEGLPEYDTAVIVFMEGRGVAMMTHYYNDFALVSVSMDKGFGEHGVSHWAAITPPTT